MQELSASLIVGAAITAALVLVILFGIIFVRRSRDQGKSSDEEKVQRIQQSWADIFWPNPLGKRESNDCLVRSVSRRNMLPLPVLQVTAARPRPRPLKVPAKPTPNRSDRPMSSAELLAHHQPVGTIPRPCISHQTSPQHIASGEIWTPPSPSPSASSFSNSIVSYSLRSSLSPSLRSSLFGADEGTALLKDRQMSAPILSYEGVPPPHEKVMLNQPFYDGRSIVVGSKSRLHGTPTSGSGEPTEYAFGQGTTFPNVEIVTVPLRVIEKRGANGSAKTERAMRRERIQATLQSKVDYGDARNKVISWANF